MKNNRYVGSTISLVIGLLLVSTSSMGNDPTLGLLMIAGSIAYITRKTISSGGSKFLLPFEVIAIVSIIYLTWLGIATDRWYSDPLTFVVAPIWIFVAYSSNYYPNNYSNRFTWINHNRKAILAIVAVLILLIVAYSVGFNQNNYVGVNHTPRASYIPKSAVKVQLENGNKTKPAPIVSPSPYKIMISCNKPDGTVEKMSVESCFDLKRASIKSDLPKIQIASPYPTSTPQVISNNTTSNNGDIEDATEKYERCVNSAIDKYYYSISTGTPEDRAESIAHDEIVSCQITYQSY